MEDLRSKLVYTAVVYFLFLQLALRYGICGPTLSDLKENLGVDTSSITTSVSVMCLGICIGAISSGILCKFLSRELLAFILILATALLVASITFLKLYSLFLLWNLLVGATSGAAISLCESWILEIWGKQCGPYMQALQFFRGLGYIIAPILADPFLSNKEDDDDEEDEGSEETETGSLLGNFTTSTINNISTATTPAIEHHHFNGRIRTPFILNATMLGVGAALVLCLYLFQMLRRKRSNRRSNLGASQIEIISSSVNSITEKPIQTVILDQKKVETTPISPKAKYFSWLIVLLSSLFYLSYYEEIIVIFLPSFATKLPLNMTKSQASLLTTTFSIANVLAKCLSVLLALKISHITLLYANLIIMTGSAIMIILFGSSSILLLWIGITLHGIGLSSVIACLYTLLDSAIQMNTLICGILNCAGTMGSIIIPLVIGGHLDERPMSLMYACLCCCAICCVLYVTIHILLLKKDVLIAEKKSVGSSCEKGFEKDPKKI